MRQPYVTKKVSKRTGQTRYTAMYFDDKGIRRSAGTYDDELEVLGAARREQGKEAGDSLDSMTLAQKAGRDFRGVLADLREASPGGAQHNAELFLDVDQPRPALFGNVPHRDVQLHQRDQVLHGPHRGRGDCQYSEALPLATSPSRSKTVFWNLCSHLPLETQRLFAEYIISTGVRFCEAISFQEGDLNYGTGMLTICRSTVEVSKKYHPTGAGS